MSESFRSSIFIGAHLEHRVMCWWLRDTECGPGNPGRRAGEPESRVPLVRLYREAGNSSRAVACGQCPKIVCGAVRGFHPFGCGSSKNARHSRRIASVASLCPGAPLIRHSAISCSNSLSVGRKLPSIFRSANSCLNRSRKVIIQPELEAAAG